MDIIADLVAEDDRLEAILETYTETKWLTESLCPGWTMADVMLHLAQSDEAVIASAGAADAATALWRSSATTVDGLMEEQVQRERAAPSIVFERWKTARRGAVDALRAADPNVKLRWAAAPLRPATLATTRIAEHWAHALDVTEPLGVALPDTNRLRHIAWLGHSTLRYAFGLAGLQPQPIRCELTGPNGDVWTFGPEDAESRITGPVGDFCRIGAQRMSSAASALVATGPHAAAALGVLRNYAA
jgi:uncharacterized protein (TIGR03084 family)